LRLAGVALWGALSVGVGGSDPNAGRRHLLTTEQRRAVEPHADAGAGLPDRSDEDREIIENLELLEHLDESRDLDLLLELSKNEASRPPQK